MSFAGAVIVLGASAGGVQSLQAVVGGLSRDLDGAVFVALHVPASQRSSLPEILSRAGPLPACHPENGQPIRPGQVYVAPPGRDLLVESDAVQISQGPQQNRHWPSIDALFRSAANNYGRRVIGVVLSGALDDGTRGLQSIKRHGGTTIVQEPSDAWCNSMPLSAISRVEIDHRLPAAHIGQLLVTLSSSKIDIHSTDAISAAEKAMRICSPHYVEQALLSATGAPAPNPGQLASAFEVLSDCLRKRLHALFGQVTTTELFAHARALSICEFPWLAGALSNNSEGCCVDALYIVRTELARDEIAEGFSAVLANYLRLLGLFVGDDLVLDLVQQAWGTAYPSGRTAERLEG
jgi:hypothetical protein